MASSTWVCAFFLVAGLGPRLRPDNRWDPLVFRLDMSVSARQSRAEAMASCTWVCAFFLDAGLGPRPANRCRGFLVFLLVVPVSAVQSRAGAIQSFTWALVACGLADLSTNILKFCWFCKLCSCLSWTDLRANKSLRFAIFSLGVETLSLPKLPTRLSIGFCWFCPDLRANVCWLFVETRSLSKLASRLASLLREGAVALRLLGLFVGCCPRSRSLNSSMSRFAIMFFSIARDGLQSMVSGMPQNPGLSSQFIGWDLRVCFVSFCCHVPFFLEMPKRSLSLSSMQYHA